MLTKGERGYCGSVNQFNRKTRRGSEPEPTGIIRGEAPYFIEQYPTTVNGVLAEELGLSQKSIERRAKMAGLVKTLPAEKRRGYKHNNRY